MCVCQLGKERKEASCKKPCHWRTNKHAGLCDVEALSLGDKPDVRGGGLGRNSAWSLGRGSPSAI